MLPSNPEEKHSFWPQATASTGPSCPLNGEINKNGQNGSVDSITDSSSPALYQVGPFSSQSPFWLNSIPNTHHIQYQTNTYHYGANTFTSWSSDADSTRGSVGWNRTDRTPSKWLLRVYLCDHVRRNWLDEDDIKWTRYFKYIININLFEEETVNRQKRCVDSVSLAHVYPISMLSVWTFPM